MSLIPPQTVSVRHRAERRGEWILAATVLTSAWLLFQVQPMAAKRILPWFGGGPAVWATAMLFFQAALLAGYSYAHLSSRWLRPRAQAFVHAGLIAAAIASLAVNGVIAGDAWKPASSDHPRWGILMILAATVGLPYTLLAATAPLVQSWWGRTHAAGSPYRLYALSNFGSLAALVSYPLVVEPQLGLGVQGLAWSVTFGVFAALCVGSAVAGAQPTALKERPVDSERPHAKSPAWTDWFHWIALPACASVVLLAVTNYLCQDVASLPLLWVAPLAIYLVTFIVAFDADRWYRRDFWFSAFGAASIAAVWSWQEGANQPLGWQVAIHLALLLTVGMVCHGEVARRRPPTARLTAFYLCLSVGGVLGGLLVAVVAPLVFPDYYELPLGMLAAWVLAMCSFDGDSRTVLEDHKRMALWIVVAVLWATLAVLATLHYASARGTTVASARNFFGVLNVQDRDASGGAKIRRLLNGRISHGSQFQAVARRAEPTTYYSPESGVGRLLAGPVGTPRRVGVVGLGSGTIAAYAEAGDEFRFYDINPQVIEFADRYFTYLEDARRRGATITIVEDDARLAMERDDPQQFDVLALDAFSGDAIPVHLLTLEAVELYLTHLRQPGGVLTVHISNKHLDLAPVVLAAADRFDLDARVVSNGADKPRAVESATWILLRPRGQTGQPLPGEPLDSEENPVRRVAWTDDFSSLWSVLKRE